MAGIEKTQADRRRFLKSVAALGGATVLIGTGGNCVADAEPESQVQAPPDDAAEPAGYRETAHVRTYYEKARI